MAATVISLIHSTLGDIELMETSSSDVFLVLLRARMRPLKDMLRKLRTFLLSVRNLGNDVHMRPSDNNRDNNDGSLGFLLERIADTICSNGPEFQLRDGRIPPNVQDKIIKFESSIDSFVKEVNEWYIFMSEYSWKSSCPTIKEVMELAESILENQADFTAAILIDINDLFKFSRFSPFVVIDPTEALGEKIKFLQNLIRFASLQSVEDQQLEDLLTHIQAVFVNAAHLTSNLSGMNRTSADFKKLWESMQLKISELLQNIKPVDHRVYETYTQVLTIAKFSRRLHSPILDVGNESITTMKDFIDSLISYLWEILKETFPVVYVKDQRQVLYEELRFLRTILKEKPNKFDERMRNLTGGVVCDAGLVVFSMCQKYVDRDLGLIDLSERMRIIRAEMNEAFVETSKLSLNGIDFLLENLAQILKADSNSTSYVKIITKDLFFLRSFFGEIMELQHEEEELQALWTRFVEVAYKMEFLIDPLEEVGDIPYSFSTLYESITEDIQNIRTDALRISDSKRLDNRVQEAARTSTSRVHSQNSEAPITNEFVGFDVEAKSIIDRLTRRSEKLKIVSIVGMPGSGKTTLATKVYNDFSVMCHFHVRAWCNVSQVFNKRNVLLELLKQIVTDLPDGYFDKKEQDLAEDLRHRLKGRKYLIFLDDVWDIQAWHGLGASFADDSKGSRIILTSRVLDVVPHALLDEEPHFLRQLTDEESWELLQKKLFPGNCCPQDLYEYGVQIAEKCKGLPLTIVIVAGLLATMEQEGWKEVLESLSSGIISRTEQCMNTVELSYKHLPNCLKVCLLYFGAFPEDQEVSVQRLIWLWIAEGFVRKTEVKSLEQLATEYVMDLVGRSLVMVAKQRSTGGVKTCRIHDVLHDFCRTKAKEENFFHLLKGPDELLAFNEPCYMRRLCIHSKPFHLKESKIFCPRARSLLCCSQIGRHDPSWIDISFVIHIFKLLKVLDIQQIDSGCVFPREIEQLVQLKYLAIQVSLELIPSSISNLSKLETFILDPQGMLVYLQDGLWDLQKLRHICLRNGYNKFLALVLPRKNLDDYPDLCELVSFSGAAISSGLLMEKQMKKFPNIHKLKCKIYINRDEGENSNKIVVPDSLNQLESLNMSFFKEYQDPIDLEIGFPKNLKKLTLAHLQLPWSKISTIGQLPNLEVLKLLESFTGETWEMEEGEFLKLRFLKLASLDIVRLTDSAADDPFPSLEKLVLESCRRLEELPSCLESSPTLEMIEVSSCSECISSLVQQIQDFQIDNGNSEMKILIHQSRGSSRLNF